MADPQKTPPPVQKAETKSLRVVATAVGTYRCEGEPRAFMREVGDRFLLRNEADFSASWMRRVTDGEPVAAGPRLDIPQTTAPHKVIRGDFPLPPT